MTNQHAPDILEEARKEVLAWIRSPERNPLFLEGQYDPTKADLDRAIIERFMSWVEPCGFTRRVVDAGTRPKPAFDVHWQHQGASFVGFSQPPSAKTATEAEMLACAALLRNQWCRDRLR